MVNVNSRVDELVEAMSISIVSDVQMEDPGSLLLVEKTSERGVYLSIAACIFLCILYTSFVFSWMYATVMGIQMISTDSSFSFFRDMLGNWRGWTLPIGWIVGLVFIVKKFIPVIKKARSKSDRIIEVYEQGLLIKRKNGTIENKIGTKTIENISLDGKTLIIVQGGQNGYSDVNEYSALKNPKRLYTTLMLLNLG